MQALEQTQPELVLAGEDLWRPGLRLLASKDVRRPVLVLRAPADGLLAGEDLRRPSLRTLAGKDIRSRCWSDLDVPRGRPAPTDPPVADPQPASPSASTTTSPLAVRETSFAGDVLRGRPATSSADASSRPPRAVPIPPARINRAHEQRLTLIELPGAAKHPTQLLLDPGVGRVNKGRRMPFRTDGQEPSLWRPRGLRRGSTSRSPSAGILPAISGSILSFHKPWQTKAGI